LSGLCIARIPTRQIEVGASLVRRLATLRRHVTVVVGPAEGRFRFPAQNVWGLAEPRCGAFAKPGVGVTKHALAPQKVQ